MATVGVKGLDRIF